MTEMMLRMPITSWASSRYGKGGWMLPVARLLHTHTRSAQVHTHAAVFKCAFVLHICNTLSLHTHA